MTLRTKMLGCELAYCGVPMKVWNSGDTAGNPPPNAPIIPQHCGWCPLVNPALAELRAAQGEG